VVRPDLLWQCWHLRFSEAEQVSRITASLLPAGFSRHDCLRPIPSRQSEGRRADSIRRGIAHLVRYVAKGNNVALGPVQRLKVRGVRELLVQ